MNVSPWMHEQVVSVRTMDFGDQNAFYFYLAAVKAGATFTATLTGNVSTAKPIKMRFALWLKPTC